MFRNRGEIPEINFNENNDNNDNNENNGYNVPHYTHYPRRNFFIICYDWHFFAIEVVTTLVAIVIAFGIYLFAYKVDFNDPLENVKNGFLVSQLLAILVAGIVAGIATFISKSQKALIKSLKIILLVSIIAILTFLGVKIYMDNKYDEEIFLQFYETIETPNKDANSKKVVTGLNGIKLLNEKDAYIEKCVEAYTHFKIKTIVYMILHTIEIIVLIYLIYGISKKENKKEKLYKDDIVIFDEEENVKM